MNTLSAGAGMRHIVFYEDLIAYKWKYIDSQAMTFKFYFVYILGMHKS